jgi:hypothetical protein
MTLKLSLATILLGLIGQVYACKCGGPGTVKETYGSTDLIVYGKVLNKKTVPFIETLKDDKIKRVKENLKNDPTRLERLNNFYVYKIELEIIRIYKGGQTKGTLTIYTAMTSASCGYKFENNKTYIIYSSKGSNLDGFVLADSDINRGLGKDNTYWTNICTRTAEYNKVEADELDELR